MKMGDKNTNYQEHQPSSERGEAKKTKRLCGSIGVSSKHSFIVLV